MLILLFFMMTHVVIPHRFDYQYIDKSNQYSALNIKYSNHNISLTFQKKIHIEIRDVFKGKFKEIYL